MCSWRNPPPDELRTPKHLGKSNSFNSYADFAWPCIYYLASAMPYTLFNQACWLAAPVGGVLPCLRLSFPAEGGDGHRSPLDTRLWHNGHPQAPGQPRGQPAPCPIPTRDGLRACRAGQGRAALRTARRARRTRRKHSPFVLSHLPALMMDADQLGLQQPQAAFFR